MNVSQYGSGSLRCTGLSYAPRFFEPKYFAFYKTFGKKERRFIILLTKLTLPERPTIKHLELHEKSWKNSSKNATFLGTLRSTTFHKVTDQRKYTFITIQGYSYTLIKCFNISHKYFWPRLPF